MIDLHCLCGRVRIRTLRRPEFINACNCSLCRKTGARWVYFHPEDVSVAGTTHGYSREDKEDPGADVRFCQTCGSTTHFRLTPGAVARFGDVQSGVNMALAEEEALAGIELRYPDGRAWPGHGESGVTRAPRIIGGAAAPDQRQDHPRGPAIRPREPAFRRDRP